MTILVKPVQHVNPQDLTTEKKWNLVQSMVRQVEESEATLRMKLPIRWIATKQIQS